MSDIKKNQEVTQEIENKDQINPETLGELLDSDLENVDGGLAFDEYRGYHEKSKSKAN